MILRDAFEIFCNRGATTYRGVPKRACGGMDAKSWRKMLQDSKVYRTPKALASGVLVFSEVCGGMRVMDYDSFEYALSKVGKGKGMTGSDIAAYLCHMAEQFHATSGGSMPKGALTKDEMKAAIKKRTEEKPAKITHTQPEVKAKPISKVKAAAKAIMATQVMAGTGASVSTKDSEPKAPNLKEIAKQNQALDAQKAILVEINRQLATRKPLEVDETESKKGIKKATPAPGAFSWDAKESYSIKLRENASAWGWYSVEGHDVAHRK